MTYPIVFGGALAAFVGLLPEPVGWIAAGGTVVLVLLVVIASSELRIADLETAVTSYSSALETVRSELLLYEGEERRLTFAKWNDVWVVDGAGGAAVTRTLCVRADGPTPVSRVELTVGGVKLSKVEQRSFQGATTVREAAGNGRLPVTFTWTSESKVVIWAFLPNALSTGGEATIVVTYNWPRMFEGFRNQQTETVAWNNKRPIEELTYRIELDKRLKRKHSLGTVLIQLDTQPDQRLEGGRWIVSGAERGLQADRRYALRLDPTV